MSYTVHNVFNIFIMGSAEIYLRRPKTCQVVICFLSNTGITINKSICVINTICTHMFILCEFHLDVQQIRFYNLITYFYLLYLLNRRKYAKLVVSTG